MAKHYFYMLAVWLKLEAIGVSDRPEEELQEFLEEEFQISDLELLEKDEDEFTFSMRIQTTFSEAQMEDEYYPSDAAVEELACELRTYLEAKFQVNYLDVEESHLIEECDDNDAQT